MSTEAVIVAEAAGEQYELGKFAGTWINEDFSWSRCDLGTFTKRVRAALGADDVDAVRTFERDGVRADPTLYCMRAAAAIFEFCEKHDWKIEVMCDEELWDRYKGREMHVAGNRYDAGEGR